MGRLRGALGFPGPAGGARAGATRQDSRSLGFALRMRIADPARQRARPRGRLRPRAAGLPTA